MIIIKNNKTYNVEYNEGVTYNKQVKYTEPPTPTLNYFYVEDISGSNNTFSIKKSAGDDPSVEVFKSTNGIDWTSMGTTDTTAITATVPANSKLYLKATTTKWGGGAWGYGGNEMTCSGNYNVGGNIMSLLNGDNFEGTRFPDKGRQFQRLFQGSTTLVNAKDIVFPNNTNYACYRGMFSGCTSLVSVSAYADAYDGNGFDGWLNNVSATGDFYNLGGATFPSGGSGIPSGWTEHKANCNVSISAGSNGSVSVNGVTGNYSQSVAYNTQLTLVATPDSGYIFGSWSDGDTNATRTITVTNDLTLTAAFYLNANYNVSISAGSNGTVSVNGVSGNYSQSVLNGTQLTLVATPDSGYVFDDWSDGDTNATRTITVTNDLTLTAAFEVYTGVPDYHIQYTTTDNNQLSLSNSVITNHTFTNGVGDITINTTTLPARFFEGKTTLRTLAYGGNIEFADGGYQHSGCENLESVDLPANMTYIPQRWFRTCRKLSRLDLPVSAMTWNITWPFYYTATQTTEGVLHVYVHNSTTLPTMDYTQYGDPHDTDFYVTGNNSGSHGLNIENLIRLYVPSSLYNDYITTAPHSSVASCISSY